MAINEAEAREKVVRALESCKVQYDYLDCFVVDGDKVIFDVGAMYDPVSLGFAALQALAKEFNTMHVDVDAGQHNGGCETCDYGSRYGHEITIIANQGYTGASP